VRFPTGYVFCVCIQLTKTETGTAKISLYSISSCVRAKSLTNYFEVNDLFTWGYRFLVPNFQDSTVAESEFFKSMSCGVDGGTFHFKFPGTEFPDIVSEQIGDFLGLHETII
jgi:hypothetical protein